MKIKKLMTATLAAVLCVTGVSFSSSAVEPRYGHTLVCSGNDMHFPYTDDGETDDVCYVKFHYCTRKCTFPGCSYTDTVRIDDETYGHDWSESTTCSRCGKRHPLDIDSADTETHTH